MPLCGIMSAIEAVKDGINCPGDIGASGEEGSKSTAAATTTAGPATTVASRIGVAAGVGVEASVPGTPPSSPVLATTMITQDIVEGAAISSGANNADKSFLLPGPGFVSPVEGVAGGLEADGGGGRSGDSNPSTRRNLRKTVEGRDELFKRRLKQLRHKDMLFELMEDGTYEMKHMSMREVFNYVQECVAPYAMATVLSPSKDVKAGLHLVLSTVPSGLSPTPPTPPTSSPNVARETIGPGFTGIPRMRRSWSNPGSMSLSNLHLRDLRQLFSSQVKSEPAISVRRNCILVNFETLRGIVLVDRLLLVVDPGADSILMEVRKAVSESGDDVYEFELKVLEALLLVSSKRLKREVHEVERPLEDIVHTLVGPGRAATSAENNDRFRNLANDLNLLESTAKARRRALLMVLEDDTDLAMMNLTRMCQSPEDYVPPLSKEVLGDHEEIELLLEAYLQDINTVINGLELLQGRARSTEALVMVKLDIARNRILTAGLVFSMLSACFTLGTLASGIFGMNLYSGLEKDQILFKVVSIGAVAISVIAFAGVFTFFYRQGILVS